MLPSTALLLLAPLPVALAQYGGSPPAAASSTPSASPATTSGPSVSIQTITVGQNNAIAFSPNTIVAAPGSQVEFIFFPPQHSVVQAAFDAPCQPISDTGFFSGTFTTSSGANANSFTITINDTNPIWFFCGFPGHCEAGMAGVINAPSSGNQTLADFQAAAAKVSSTTEPTFSVQGGVVGPVKAASSGSTTTSSGAAGPSQKSGSASELRGSVIWAGILGTLVAARGAAELMG